jgi:hypothetical protein
MIYPAELEKHFDAKLICILVKGTRDSTNTSTIFERASNNKKKSTEDMFAKRNTPITNPQVQYAKPMLIHVSQYSSAEVSLYDMVYTTIEGTWELIHEHRVFERKEFNIGTRSGSKFWKQRAQIQKPANKVVDLDDYETMEPS